MAKTKVRVRVKPELGSEFKSNWTVYCIGVFLSGLLHSV